ncbi:MAG: oligogalacturonate lyase family protein [Thermoguttaceae bacterium]|nr:oligogalacturonate lyase family protein [Thermoguttaceae bacterium]MDW8038765.1 hypothetical protein [Thermoguttaceae bacterium]
MSYQRNRQQRFCLQEIGRVGGIGGRNCQGNFRGISRRTALGRLAGVAAGAIAGGIGVPRLLHAGPEAQPIQVSKEDLGNSNIYCEVPYCSSDSRYFVYARRNPNRGSGSPKERANGTELVAVELGSWKQERLDVAASITGLAVSAKGIFYYLQRTGEGQLQLMRVDINRGQPQPVYARKDQRWIHSLGTVSYDERYYAGGVVVGEGWKRFGIVVVDLEKGTEAVIDEDPYILNPHPQFDPGPRYRLMIQQNRGGQYSPDGKLQRLVGQEGATLYLLSVPDGKRTTLQVGTPYTTPCTGHEAWIGTSGQMILTVSATGQYAPDQNGNLLTVAAGEPAKVLGVKGFVFNHVGVSRCGRLFSCDDWRPPYRIVIGSTKTGQSAVVCASETKPQAAQNTHPHPYLTPDLKWVIFNSNRTGVPHVYAAPVPEDVVLRLLREAKT